MQQQIKLSDSDREYDSNIETAKRCIINDIERANGCYHLMFTWINGILKTRRKFWNKYNLSFDYIKYSIETTFILSLYKIYSNNPEEECLLKLIDLSKNIPQTLLNARLVSVQNALRPHFQNERVKFLTKMGKHKKNVRNIERRLNPYRNVQLAHNFPKRTGYKPRRFIEFATWLRTAEKLYIDICNSIYDDASPAVRMFIPSTFKYELQDFVEDLKKYAST